MKPFIILLTLSTMSYGTPAENGHTIPFIINAPTESQCDKTLSLCIDYTKAQQDEIVVLKKSVKSLEDDLQAEDKGSTVSFWIVMAAGAVMGFVVGRSVR